MQRQLPMLQEKQAWQESDILYRSSAAFHFGLTGMEGGFLFLQQSSPHESFDKWEKNRYNSRYVMRNKEKEWRKICRPGKQMSAGWFPIHRESSLIIRT